MPLGGHFSFKSPYKDPSTDFPLGSRSQSSQVNSNGQSTELRYEKYKPPVVLITPPSYLPQE